MNWTTPTEKGTSVAPLIDHTVLKADAPRSLILSLCREADHYGFASVCVNPSMVSLAAEALKGSRAKVCTVIGFPLGAGTAETKAFEARNAVELGAEELDMVLPIGALKEGCLAAVSEHIAAVVAAGEGRTVKVIFETCLLNDEEKLAACRVSVDAGAQFVKTSTGFGSGGATVADIRLMRQATGPEFGVKASGGVRTLETALEMIEAGATRIGTSSGVAIVTS